MVARQLGARPDDRRLASSAYLDGIFRHQPVASHHEIESAFALVDAALAHDQHAVNHLVHGVRAVEPRRQLGNRRRRDQRCAQHRNGMPLRNGDQLRRHIPASRNHHARDVMAEGGHQGVGPLGRVLPIEILDLALPEDEHAPRLQVLGEAGKGKACFLNMRAADHSFKAGAAAEQLEGQAERLGTASKQAADGKGERHIDAQRDAPEAERTMAPGIMPAASDPASSFGFNQIQMAVRPPKQDVDPLRRRVTKDDEGVVGVTDLQRRLVHR